MNIRHIAPHHHSTHPTKRNKMKKKVKSDHCKAIFRSRDLIFFMGAHNSIFFVNIKFFPPTPTWTTTLKGKKYKIRQIWSLLSHLLKKIVFVIAHNTIRFVDIVLFSPISTLTTPQKGKKDIPSTNPLTPRVTTTPPHLKYQNNNINNNQTWNEMWRWGAICLIFTKYFRMSSHKRWLHNDLICLFFSFLWGG